MRQTVFKSASFGQSVLHLLLLALVEHCACRLFDHGQNLWRLHVENLGDPSLHDEEMRVVDIELD